MRRTSIAVLALALPLVLPASAWAPDHRMRVNEIQLSSGGDTTKQFAELLDSVSEPFPSFTGYSITVFDAGGVAMGTQTISGAALAPGTSPYTLASNSAGGPSNQALTVTLPPGAGQVCFTRGMGGSDHIHCVAYGCEVAPLGSEGGTNRVRAPTDGQSVQRQSAGTYASAAPTQDAANSSGTAADCTPAGGGPGGGPGGGGGGGTADKLAPDQFLAYKRRQDIDRLAVTVTLDENADVTVGGSVNVPGAAKRLKFRTVRADLRANVKRKFRLKLKRKSLRAVRAALHDGRKLKAAVRITAEDAAGNVSTEKRKVRLKD